MARDRARIFGCSPGDVPEDFLTGGVMPQIVNKMFQVIICEFILEASPQIAQFYTLQIFNIRYF